MHPDEIIQLFKDKWVGTAEELSIAIDYFFSDILSSVVMCADEEPMAGQTRGEHVKNVVSDYYSNHYGEEQFE